MDEKIKELEQQNDTTNNLLNMDISGDSEKKTRTRRTKTNDDKVNKGLGELQEDICNLFNTFVLWIKGAYPNSNIHEYTKEDFKSETRGIIELSRKYPIVATIINAINPLFGLISLVQKIIYIMSNVNRNKPRKGAPKTAPHQTTEPIQNVVYTEVKDEGINDILNNYKPTGV